jgi:predicted hotdog family 3-hydroxylacyl-ACP dehydratase
MLAGKDHIIRYIPQRHPMVMIDDLLEASDTHAVTQLKIDAGNIFVERGCLAEPGLVENIAQTAAAHVGYQCAQKQVPVPIGYIAAVKNLEIVRLPEIDSVITTSIRITNQVLDVTVAVGKVEQNGMLCCSCEMRIFVKP